MGRWRHVILGSLLPAAITGVVGGLVLTTFFAGQAYWWRGR
jgi:hypothetical protein